MPRKELNNEKRFQISVGCKHSISRAAERLCRLTQWNFFERDSVVVSQNFVTPKQCSGHADGEK